MLKGSNNKCNSHKFIQFDQLIVASTAEKCPNLVNFLFIFSEKLPSDDV